MIKPLILLSLLGQLNVAPSIGDSNIAPAIGEQPMPVETEPVVVESKPEPVAVQAEVPAAPPTVPQSPIDIPVPAPLADESAVLAPPIEQPGPALEETNQPYGERPSTPLEAPYQDHSLPPVPQSQTSVLRQPRQQIQRSTGVAYRQPTAPLPTTVVETIGYPLTSTFAVTSAFGWRKHPVEGNTSFHAGIDLAAPHGTPTLAMLSGRVTHADWEGGHGKSVVIEHPGTGLKTRYAHLSQIHVQPGQWVDKGWHIGDSGATGLVTGPHAHIEMIMNGQPVDPWPYLAQASRQAVLINRFHPWAG
ncbi:peptidoglycan DD-metalloendopeptidase family protein [Acaryochloris marina NIES-2412]|uniref:peptidoglycan DD-metalloendopeptidase family protein n=1 Tax=Acaryochloris marina TaxID=155978 RepID=UPI0040585892